VNLSIRPATVADLPAMMALEKRAATAAHWSAEQYQDLLHSTESVRVAMVLTVENEVQAFMIARVVHEEWEIENIAVAAPARRRGLGSRLLGKLLDMARAKNATAIFLEVRESNQAARTLYEKWAFLESGRRRRYYSDPVEDAILYRIDFK